MISSVSTPEEVSSEVAVDSTRTIHSAENISSTEIEQTFQQVCFNYCPEKKQGQK
jgi:hypothetical protein